MNYGTLQNGVETPILAITDGTSNTVMFLESAGRPNNYVLGQDKGVTVPSGEGYGWADPDTGSGSIDGSHPITGVINTDAVYTGGTCPISCNNDSEAYGFHAGNINVGMADGSVRSLQKSISSATFSALVTRQGGEVVTVD